MSDHGVISPELALVCPELRERALSLLPDRDPDAIFPVRRPRPAAPAVAAVLTTAPPLLPVPATASPAGRSGRELAALRIAAFALVYAGLGLAQVVVPGLLLALAVGLLLTVPSLL